MRFFVAMLFSMFMVNAAFANEAAPAVASADTGVSDQVNTVVDHVRHGIRTALETTVDAAQGLYSRVRDQFGRSDDQMLGLTGGVIAGCVVADLMGGGGVVTASFVAGGGALGHWAMSEEEK